MIRTSWTKQDFRSSIRQNLTCWEILNEFSEKLVIKLKFFQEMAQAAVEEICSFSQVHKRLR